MSNSHDPRPATRDAQRSGDLMTCSAVARALGVAQNTVRHWCREGLLRDHAVRTPSGRYRVPRDVFDALLAGRPLPSRDGVRRVA